jgi:hypothetical protein
MEDVRKLIREDQPQWKRKLAPFLSDPGHLKMLAFYFKSLIMLKTKRVRDIGIRARAGQRINGILAAVGSDALTALERVIYADTHLAGSSAPDGHALSPETRAYYSEELIGNFDLLANLLGVILLFQYAHSLEDIHQLQEYIEKVLIQPLKAKSAATQEKDPAESKALKEKASSYQQLQRAVEINFE